MDAKDFVSRSETATLAVAAATSRLLYTPEGRFWAKTSPRFRADVYNGSDSGGFREIRRRPAGVSGNVWANSPTQPFQAEFSGGGQEIERFRQDLETSGE
jgi:hypothetical protein